MDSICLLLVLGWYCITAAALLPQNGDSDRLSSNQHPGTPVDLPRQPLAAGCAARCLSRRFGKDDIITDRQLLKRCFGSERELTEG